MKKLHTFAFYALITPIITLGASSLLAQPPAGASGQQPDRPETTTPRAPTSQGAQSQGQAAQSQGQAGQSQGQAAQSQGQAAQSQRQAAQNQGQAAQSQRAQTAQGQSGMTHTGFISAIPANGMHSSQLIGAEVKNSAGENFGDVRELVIDEHGQIIAVVVGVGGFLGMGERDVAFGWDDITKLPSATGSHVLTVNLNRESLRAAPEFKVQE